MTEKTISYNPDTDTVIAYGGSLEDPITMEDMQWAMIKDEVRCAVCGKLLTETSGITIDRKCKVCELRHL